MLSWNWNHSYGILEEREFPKPGDTITCMPPTRKRWHEATIQRIHQDGSHDVDIDGNIHTNVRILRGKLSEATTVAKQWFVHHSRCQIKNYGAVGFGKDGELTIGTGRVWYDLWEYVYFTRDPNHPNQAFNVTHVRPTRTSAIVDIDEEIDANQKQRSSYASDSTDDEDVHNMRVKEVQTPAKKSHANNKTPAKWVIQKKPAQSPHVGIPPSPDS
eukprot:g5952.t1